MKNMWITAGVGALVAIVGFVIWTIGRNTTLGLIVFLAGLVIAIMGLVMRMLMVYMGEKDKQ